MRSPSIARGCVVSCAIMHPHVMIVQNLYTSRATRKMRYNLRKRRANFAPPDNLILGVAYFWLILRIFPVEFVHDTADPFPEDLFN